MRSFIIGVAFATLVMLVVVLSLVFVSYGEAETAESIPTTIATTTTTTTLAPVAPVVTVQPSTTTSTTTTTTTTTIATEPIYKLFSRQDYKALSEGFINDSMNLVNGVTDILSQDPYDLAAGVYSEQMNIYQTEALRIKSDWLFFVDNIPNEFVQHYNYTAAAADSLVYFLESAVIATQAGVTYEVATMHVDIMIEELSQFIETVKMAGDRLPGFEVPEYQLQTG